MYRLAPTPSGFLHIGNAFSFLLTQRLAERAGEPLLLRIDDLDSDRKRPEYIQDIFDTLRFLGISWQLGPRDANEFESHWSQRHRVSLYHQALRSGQKAGFVFACSCSRKDFSGAYPGTCENRSLPLDAPDVAWRWKVPETTRVSVTINKNKTQDVLLAETMGSFVVRRKDGIPAYQIASLVDDLHFGVTSVVRGMDLIPSTAAQLLMADDLGFGSFRSMDFMHHELVNDDMGMKLSKSDGATSVRHLIASGISREDLIARIEPWLLRYLG